MNKLTTIEIQKQYYHFSSAHFTVFSATERERLHGHNFRIGAAITGEVDDNGLCFDYAIYKKKLMHICSQFDEYTLIAEHSPHLKIESDEQYYYIIHNGISQPLLKTDTILLPVLNITIEELSHYILGLLIEDQQELSKLRVHEMDVRVSSGPDQWGVARWQRA